MRVIPFCITVVLVTIFFLCALARIPRACASVVIEIRDRLEVSSWQLGSLSPRSELVANP